MRAFVRASIFTALVAVRAVTIAAIQTEPALAQTAG